MGWDPDQYAQFSNERLRPVEDLLGFAAARLWAAPTRAVDLGCGAGASTRLLAARFPECRIVGIDTDPAMLREARRRRGGPVYRRADIAAWQPRSRVDLAFANASLHWVPDHAALFPRIMAGLKPGGVFAAQMPHNFDAPSHALMRAIARRPPWRTWLGSFDPGIVVTDPVHYRRWLKPLAAEVDLWETTYYHVLEGVDPVAQWTRATGLRPYLEALPPDRRGPFFLAYSAAVAAAYPPERDGSVIYPFKRLFVVAIRPR